MTKKEELKESNIESDKQIKDSEINILEIPSFEFLFNLFKSEKYTINQFSNNLIKFCKESENCEYICENNKEFEIPKKQKTLFGKFNLCKNKFDFQITISDLLIQYFQFLKNIKPSNKQEYFLIKNMSQIFSDLKENKLIMEDIQCLIEYGLLRVYNNNFYLFLFDIKEKNINQLLKFFDIRKYFLSDNNNINLFIFSFNDLINKNPGKLKPVMFVQKLEIILSEILTILKTENQDNQKDCEIKHKLEIYEKIQNLINKEKIFEIFLSDEAFSSHLYILINLFKIFPNEINKQINSIISKNNKQNIKIMYKLIIKHASFLDDYIEKETLFALDKISIENNFRFYISQYNEGKNRLINIYNIFKDNKDLINKLVIILREQKKEKQAEMIEQNIYNEESEKELEEKEKIDKNKDKYFILPDNYNIYYISAENQKYIKESIEILDKLLNSNYGIIDEYLGIDTEWKSSRTFLELYAYNLNENNKNKDIIKIDKTNLSDIIQIAGNKYGFIFDTKSIYKNNKLRNKIEKLFLKNKFIGFAFNNDEKKIGEFFKKVIHKNNFIELSKVYFEIKKKKAPELKVITLELFNKELDKRDQISDWSKRPLLSNQIKYGILDAYVLILIHKKLNEKK